MEGLEFSEKSYLETLANKDFRIDSQFYTKEPVKNSKLKYEKIGNCLESAQYGISIAMNEDKNGYPIYRMNEIHSMMCDIEVNKYADITFEELETFVLNDRDVLFNRTNSFEWVGRTGLYNKINNQDFIFASYLVRFIPNQSLILPEYLTSFLNTKQGVWDIKRRARQSINQTNVNPEEVKAIDIPLLSMEIQNKIKNCFDIANKARIKSEQTYTQAEELLLQEIGLEDFELSTEKTNEKSFQESFGLSGRLDAEYYQKKYDVIENSFDKFPRIQLKELVNYPISSGITPKAGGNDYTNETEGIPFVRAVDLKNGEVNTSNFIYLKPEVHYGVLKRTQLKSNDILFSIAGTVGRTAIFSHEFKANINQAVAILRFDEIKIKRLYLMSFLNSFIGKEYIAKYARQGLQTNLNLAEVGELSIPIISFSKQQKIASLIEESFSLKKESEHLLELAKRGVELAIETDETTALKFMEKGDL